ncbi:hypothetical protein [Entomomonas asaccharolytica]|uniref:Uncharacterized protein n=1 Tax=Entomomonas asaccharolytica TaxID=2785331 RepID=A0A974RWC2_9GAMM|nr:hypothetical protein [Entomomonas asaccharolytica]QQP85086.1 hypothetical protein JHT90_11920 [Entomomonas asaccharolytica]
MIYYLLGIKKRKPTVEEFAQRYNIDLTPTQENNSSILGRVGDAGLDLAKGVVGTGEAVVGLGNLATGGRVGKLLQDYVGYDPKRTKEVLSNNYSTARQQANQEVEKADGFIDTATAMLKILLLL